MKKWFLLVLFIFIFLFTGCSNSMDEKRFNDTKNFKTLNEVTFPTKDFKNYNYNDFDQETRNLAYLNNFMNITSKELFIEEENYIYSPISLYMALSMLVQGANGQTKEELLNLLKGDTNITLETVNKHNKAIYNHNHYKNNKGQLKIANSIWIKNDFSVKEQFLNNLSENYYANAYSTNFDDEGKQNIADWINHYTNDLLNIKKDNYPITNDTVLMLINTIYFNNKWQEEFNKSNNYKDTFYGEKETNVEYMKHVYETTYYETEKYEAFYDYFENKNKIKYIFPKENSSVLECLNDNVLYDEQSEKNSIYVEMTLSVPKFKTTSKYKLNDTLKKLGLNNMFDKKQADFSNISDEELYVSFVQQDAGIILSEEGVKATAVTSIGINKESAIEPVVTVKEIILNRPFIYVISDAYGVPLFVGVVSNPKI